MEVKVMDPATWMSYVYSSRKYDQMAWYVADGFSYAYPQVLKAGYSQQTSNLTFNNDPVYDEMYIRSTQTFDLVELNKLKKEGAK